MIALNPTFQAFKARALGSSPSRLTIYNPFTPSHKLSGEWFHATLH